MSSIVANKSVEIIKSDNNLGDLENLFEIKDSEAVKLSDPDDPKYQLLKSEIRIINNRLRLIVGS